MSMSSVDELIKLKKLLDEGVLTKEEFEQQKRQILGPPNNIVEQTSNTVKQSNSNKIQSKKSSNAYYLLATIFTIGSVGFLGGGIIGGLVFGALYYLVAYMITRNKGKTSDLSNWTIFFVLSALIFGLGLIISPSLNSGNSNSSSFSSSNPSSTVSNVSVQNEAKIKEFDTLVTNGCNLYENYRITYLYVDSQCNVNDYCKGSATQKEAYETFKSWDDFKNKYCASTSKPKYSDSAYNYVESSSCKLYDNFVNFVNGQIEYCKTIGCSSETVNGYKENLNSWKSFETDHCK